MQIHVVSLHFILYIVTSYSPNYSSAVFPGFSPMLLLMLLHPIRLNSHRKCICVSRVTLCLWSVTCNKTTRHIQPCTASSSVLQRVAHWELVWCFPGRWWTWKKVELTTERGRSLKERREMLQSCSTPLRLRSDSVKGRSMSMERLVYGSIWLRGDVVWDNRSWNCHTHKQTNKQTVRQRNTNTSHTRKAQINDLTVLHGLLSLIYIQA